MPKFNPMTSRAPVVPFPPRIPCRSVTGLCCCEPLTTTVSGVPVGMGGENVVAIVVLAVYVLSASRITVPFPTNESTAELVVPLIALVIRRVTNPSASIEGAAAASRAMGTAIELTAGVELVITSAACNSIELPGSDPIW